MKKLILVMLFISQNIYAQNSAYNVSLTPEKWQFAEGKAEFFEKNGQKFMRLKQGNQGAVVLKDVTFKDGTIEFDFEPAAPMTLGSSPTVYFRGNTKTNDAEIFYIRARPNRTNANDAVQYAPILGGVNMWDMYPDYQAPAFFETEENQSFENGDFGKTDARICQ